MRDGYIKNMLASIGCLTVFVLVGFVAWEYRGHVGRAVRSTLQGEEQTGSALPQEPTVGTPSPRSLESAERKERDVGRRGGPASVRLTADEMASIIQDRLDPEAKRALDSLRVTLEEGRFTLDGQVLLEVFSQEMLGPWAQFLGGRQPLRVGGPVALRDTGILAWSADEFVIGPFPFPQSAIPSLVNHLTGGSDGALIIPVPETVGDVHVGPGGVTFYRRVD